MGDNAGVSIEKLVIVLNRAHRSLSDFLEGGLARQGILMSDFAILEALFHKGPLTPVAIAEKIPVAPTVTKRAIDRLTRRGLIEARQHAYGSDGDLYQLTTEGKKVISLIDARHQEDIESVMGVLSPAERDQLWRGLKKIGLQGERRQRARLQDHRGGLAPWQLRRATEYMTEHLAESGRLKDIAEQTGLSPSRFGHAFKLTTGTSPHKWQMRLRILEAQEMLRDGRRTHADIALATGFAEQSHFSRVFKDVVGVSPRLWQREHRA
jgi:AraC-like DNA-binding protein/predicted transcriptional regulator